MQVYISPPRGEGEGEDDVALQADMERAYFHFALFDVLRNVTCNCHNILPVHCLSELL